MIFGNFRASDRPSQADSEVMDRYKNALLEIIDLLGPFKVCSCGCEGLREEAQEALDIARKALGLAQLPRRQKERSPGAEHL